MALSAFPLSWPEGWPRTEDGFRARARFTKGERVSYGTAPGSYLRHREVSVSDGLTRVLEELKRLNVDRQDIIVSTNVRTRLDGMPRSGEPEPKDPGAAVYWQDAAEHRRVMAIDRYDRVADNLAAIAATLEAMRAIDRHGGATILDRAFTGFTALPAPGASRSWRDVLGFTVTTHPPRELLKERWRSRASSAHPDKGGSNDEMAELNRALADAEKELGYV